MISSLNIFDPETNPASEVNKNNRNRHDAEKGNNLLASCYVGLNMKVMFSFFFFLLLSDSLLHVAAGELGSLLLHSEVQSGRQRPPSWLAEETYPAGARGEPVQTSSCPRHIEGKSNQIHPAAPLRLINWHVMSHLFNLTILSGVVSLESK